jgi:protein-L-isoaspartate(D-aspartate) O-methyltransferase
MFKLGVIILTVFYVKTSTGQETYDNQRQHMVNSQLLSRDIDDPATIKAMLKVERQEFVPQAIKPYAYMDSALPIGNGQTISQPYIVAYMTQELKLKPHYRVLEIGTGSGYQAAVLAVIVDSVYTIEIVEPLGIEAKKRLKRLGYNNVVTKIGDGYHGWPEKAPFDAVIVTAAVDEEIPPALIDQLADGGRMIIPVGRKAYHRNLVLVTKKNVKVRTKNRIPVAFVPFTRNKL